MSFKKVALITTLASAFFLSACDNETTNQTTTSNTIKVGVISGPEQEVAEVAKQQAKDLYNLDVELVIFNDYVTPNEALNDGSIDVNAFQNIPYLNQQVAERGYKLATIGNTFVYPLAAYSKKLKATNEITSATKGVKVTSPRAETFLIPDNATIAVPNDPTNLGRSLLLLQNEGLITVDKSKGLYPTVLDITINTHNYNIVELEGPMLPRSLEDAKIDLAIINNSFAGQINLTASKDSIFVENSKSPYVNIIVAREDNKNDTNVINFVKAFQTDLVEKKANEVFQGSAIRGW